jgi:hypothetical protein
MGISAFLSPSDTLIDLRASDKARLLQELSRRAAASLDLPSERIAALSRCSPLPMRERMQAPNDREGSNAQ